MKRQFIVPLVLILLTSSFLLVAALPAKAEPKTIIVPDDYPTIQLAIGNASAGDTVFVRNGTYKEAIRIDKPLALIGENRKNTTIVSVKEYPNSPPAILVQADCTISGFTIKRSEEGGEGGIAVYRNPAEAQPLQCRITDNIITKNILGIEAGGKVNVIISGNDITENYFTGIDISSEDGLIFENNVNDNGFLGSYTGQGRGLGIAASGNNLTIRDNNISRNNAGGVKLSGSGPFSVHDNNITLNYVFGVQLTEGCRNSTVYKNTIWRNDVGVDLENHAIVAGSTEIGSGNMVYRNNFLYNTRNAVVERRYPYEVLPPINGTDTVTWDDGEVGNFWSDYSSRYPNASTVGFSGIGDTPYMIDENNIDRYPLLQPVNISETVPPTFQTLLPLIAAGVVVVAAILLLVYRTRKRMPKP